jgi:predicted metal-dependent HD superfamily phosphohydrolase
MTDTFSTTRPSILQLWLTMAPNKNFQETGPLLDNLVSTYRGPGRWYHNWSHIEGGIETYRDFYDKIDRNVFFAWMYHDSVYDPQAHDNEERSAKAFLGDNRTLGFNNEDADKIAMAILSTTHTGEINMVTDMDLAGLGADPVTFANNTDLIRREYHFVDESTWRAGRAAILKQFLDRITTGKLYHTTEYAGAFTSAAKSNLTQAIKKLTGPPA